MTDSRVLTEYFLGHLREEIKYPFAIYAPWDVLPLKLSEMYGKLIEGVMAAKKTPSIIIHKEGSSYTILLEYCDKVMSVAFGHVSANHNPIFFHAADVFFDVYSDEGVNDAFKKVAYYIRKYLDPLRVCGPSNRYREIW